MRHFAVVLTVLLSGCGLFATPGDRGPDITTRFVLVDFETREASVGWCIPNRIVGQPGPCTLCGEFTLAYDEFRMMSDAEVEKAIVSQIKNAAVRSGEACERKR